MGFSMEGKRGHKMYVCIVVHVEVWKMHVEMGFSTNCSLNYSVQLTGNSGVYKFHEKHIFF